MKPLGGADVQDMSDADLTSAITNGKGKMNPYKGKLTDAQIKDLVSYVRRPEVSPPTANGSQEAAPEGRHFLLPAIFSF